MALKILFDSTHNPIPPTILLANRRGNCYGMLPNCYALNVEDCFNGKPFFTFKISKYDNGKVFHLWNKVKDFKLIYCLEWDMWFEITVELDDSDETIKTIFASGLAQSELSNVRLYGIEINTENDIARDDYVIPTTLYNPSKPGASLLNRIMTGKASHYRIAHVDDSIKDIQRTFSFDNVSIKDALDEIAQEIGCLVIYGNGNNKLENEHSCPERTISLYDLKKVCKNCGTRYDTYSSCPKCGSTDYISGYGHDTPILVSKDNLTSEVIYSADTDSMKNCFHLVAGDDLMTATVRNCNPNGTAYIFQISDEDKLDMPTELVEKLNSYNKSYDYYYYEYQSNLSSELVQDYNTLVAKYQEYDSEIPTLPETSIGYAQLMENVYNVIDFDSYLTTSLMPTYHMQDTTAETEVSKLTQANLSPIGVSNIKSISSATADSYVLEMAKIIVDSRYRVKIDTSSFNKDSLVWTGNFIVTNYSDEDDTATSNSVNVIVTEDYERFIKQKIDKVFSKNDTEDYSISSVMKMSLGVDGETFSGEFVEALKRYSLSMLKTMLDCCQGCISVLTEQGIGNAELWKNSTPDMYTKFYLQYYNKSRAIEAEISVRQKEVNIIEKVMDNIDTEREFIRNELNFEKYLGTDLWKTFCAYRRDDEYSNNNYISDGLSNKELFQNAMAFIEEANKELYKSATLQHNITSTLKNLLAVKEFAPLVDYFEVGNWIRIEVDGSIYKLRLLKYSIDFDNFTEINVTFSDVEKYKDCATDVKSVLDQASSMNRTYNYVSKQSSKGDEALRQIEGWQKDSLAMTDIKLINDADNQDILWDSHGMIFRKFDSITGEYDPNLIRIINSTISISTDGGKITRTAIGNFLYRDLETGEIIRTCGINGETVIGKLLLGEQLGIYNNGGTLKFDRNGLVITNDINTFTVNPNDSKKLLALSSHDKDILYVDENGMLHIEGDGAGLDISANDSVNGLSSRIQANAEGLSAEINRATSAEGSLSTRIIANADGLSAEIERASSAEGNLSTRIQANADGLSAEIERANKEEGSLSTRIQANADGLSAEIKRANDSEGQLSNKIATNAEGISAEITRAKSAESGLSSSINSTKEELSNKIQVNAEGLSAEITRAKGAEGDLSTSISATAEAIRTEVKNTTDGLDSKIDQTASEIRQEVTDKYNGLDSKITQTADNITSTVSKTYVTTATYEDGIADVKADATTKADNALASAKTDATAKANTAESNAKADTTEKLKSYSTTIEMNSAIKQTADNITSTVSKKVGKDEVISAINQSAESITISASKINLQGAVTFSCLDSDAQNQITTAQSTANSASSAASSAQSTANSASSLASSAQSLASSANSTINSWGYDTNNTYINGGKIYTGTITANQIAAHSITTDELATDAIQSIGYVAGTGTYSTTGTFFNLADGSIKSPNFAIDSSGSAYFNGAISSVSGNIGGIDIFSDHIGNSDTGMSVTGWNGVSNTGWRLWVRQMNNSTYGASNGGLRVDKDGTTYIGKLNVADSNMTVGGKVTFTGTVDMSGATVKLPSDFNIGGGATDPTYATTMSISGDKLSLKSDTTTLKTVTIGTAVVDGKSISPSTVTSTGGIKAGTWLSASSSLQIGDKFYVYSDGSGAEVTNRLIVGGHFVTQSEVYFQNFSGNGQTTGGNNLIIFTGGSSDGHVLMRSSSSIRYKDVISELNSKDINKLYDIPTYWFKYKSGYLIDEDERVDKPIPGFIVEDFEDIMPIAINHNSDGSPEMWNNEIITPLMFEMIKDTHSETMSAKDRVAVLENEIEELKETNKRLENTLNRILQVD